MVGRTWVSETGERVVFLSLLLMNCVVFSKSFHSLGSWCSSFLSCFFFNKFFLCFFLRERGKKHRWGRDRERGGTEDLKQALCWQQRTWCRAWTRKLWDHDLSRNPMLNCLTDPGAPWFPHFSMQTMPFSRWTKTGALPAMLLLCICPGEMKAYVHTGKTCTQMFTAALFQSGRNPNVHQLTNI